jgi:MFS family permease
MGFGSLISKASAEVGGWTNAYRLSLILALAFTIVGGAVNESRVLAVARTVAGTFCAGSVGIGSGVINDLWDVKHSKPGTLAAFLYVFAVTWATQIGPMMSVAIVWDHEANLGSK